MLTTLIKVKNAIQTELSTNADTLLTRLIDEVCYTLERRTNRNLMYGTYVETFDGDGCEAILLRGAPVWSLTSVTVDAVAVTLSDLDIDYERGVIYNEDLWTEGTQNIVVTYVCGWKSADYSNWTAATNLTLGNFRLSTTSRRFVFEVTTQGTTGSTEPTWSEVNGAITADNSVRWTARGHLTPPDLEGVVTAEVVARFIYYSGENRSGEQLGDLRTRFLSAEVLDWIRSNRFWNV